MIRRLIYLAAVVSVAGCGLTKQTAPSLSGPASFGVTLAVTASPDVLTQNGSATSFIQIVATDANNQPIPNMVVRADTFVGGNQVDLGALSAKSITTSAAGRGTVVYTSPAAPSPSATSDTIVTLSFTPVGQNFANATPRGVDIRLARPTATPSSTDVQALFTFASTSPAVGDSVAFDASSSKAGPGRTIVSYAWDFGGGSTASGKNTTHVFSQAGAAAATLTITDDIGRTAATTQILTLAASLPTADFVTSPTSPVVGTAIVFNGLTSKPGTGRTIVGYAWDFGDGVATTSGPTTQHTYSVLQTFVVTLTVTDDVGQTATVAKAITIGSSVAVANFSFVQTTPGAAVAFDASLSAPSAGATITTYDWDFGDSSPHGTGSAPNHTYAAPGTFTVVLTITDSNGKTAAKSLSVHAN